METIRKLGPTYKKIRISKNIKQQTVTLNEMSRTTLSKFESGNHSILLHNFLHLLNKIDMTFDEFYFIVNEYEVNPPEKILYLFLDLPSEPEKIEISELIRKCYDYLSRHENWYIESILFILLDYENSEEKKVKRIFEQKKVFVNKTWKRLSELDVWYLVDFKLINAILLQFPIEVAQQISKEVSHRLNKYLEFSDILPLKTSLELNMSLLFLQNGKIKEAKKNAQLAYSYAKMQKRFDFLVFSLIRLGISLDSCKLVYRGLSIAEVTDKDVYSIAKKEVVNLAPHMSIDI
jgi:transcriptional regulator with XRE-family HTH domain